ncbi:hypothetical protein [Vibrio mediterranei]|uniref:hypothetical protein n=1 Tax=Vibrio mediterranei TaxID=689 RepID=UPI0040691986
MHLPDVTIAKLPAAAESRLVEIFTKHSALRDAFADKHIELEDLSKDVDPDSNEYSLIIEGLSDFHFSQDELRANSQRALNTITRSYVKFCREIHLYALPFEPLVVLGYLMSLEQKGLKFNSIKQHRAQLAKLAEIAGLMDPTSHKYIKAYMSGLETRLAKNSPEKIEPKQAPPFQAYHLQLVLDKWGDTVTKRALRLRDIAVLVLAWSTALRQEEIREMRIQDVKTEPDGSLLISRRLSKTKKRGLGPKKVSPFLAQWITKYLNKRHHEAETPLLGSDYLVSAVTPNGELFTQASEKMTGRGLNGIFERAFLAIDITARKEKSKLVKKLGSSQVNKRDYDPNGRCFTGHSGRVGCLVDAKLNQAKLKLTDDDLLRVGDWRSRDMMDLYLRNLVAEESPTHKVQYLLQLSNAMEE